MESLYYLDTIYVVLSQRVGNYLKCSFYLCYFIVIQELFLYILLSFIQTDFILLQWGVHVTESKYSQ